jgi:Leucine-rich repeat (LRR) protein
LAGLSNLEVLDLNIDDDVSGLRALEGISPAVKGLCIRNEAPGCLNLAGIEVCTSIEKLSLSQVSHLSSFKLLSGLSSMEELEVTECGLTSLDGLEGLSALKSLQVMHCGVTSLQPLSQLGEGLQVLRVYGCEGVQEEVLELPHVQPTADVDVRCGNVKEVVLAGGVRLAYPR